MIGVFRTIHPETGQGIVVRFTRINKNVRIYSITDSAGKDIWGTLTSEQIQKVKTIIPAPPNYFS